MVDAADLKLLRPRPALDEAVILLDKIIEILVPNQLEQDWTFEPVQHPFNVLNAFGVGRALVEDDLARQAVHLHNSGENLIAAGLFRRSKSIQRA